MLTRLADIQKYQKNYSFLPVVLEIDLGNLELGQIVENLRKKGRKIGVFEKTEESAFVGISPSETYFIQDRILFQSQKGKAPKKIPGNPFYKLGEVLQSLKTPRLPNHPSLLGCSLGYVSSECYQYIENLPTPTEKYGKYDAYFMIFKKGISIDFIKKRIFIFVLITSQKEYQKACREINAIRKRIEQPNPTQGRLLKFELMSQMGKKDFVRNVQKIKKHIRDGDLFQCVLAEAFQFRFTADSFEVFKRLRRISSTPYRFYLNTQEEALLGASPEMLARVIDKKIQTCPIAGTRPRGQTLDQDLRQEIQLRTSVKENAEHLMLVDLGRNDLGKVSVPKTVRVQKFKEVQRFSNVMHLVSLVEGQLQKGKTAWDVLGACFPAGTLSGAPKIKALEILSSLEKRQRGPYGGAVVCMDFHGDLDSCITIRSLYIRDGLATFQAGAGIVADSRPEFEYQEILHKTRAIREVLGVV